MVLPRRSVGKVHHSAVQAMRRMRAAARAAFSNSEAFHTAIHTAILGLVTGLVTGFVTGFVTRVRSVVRGAHSGTGSQVQFHPVQAMCRMRVTLHAVQS